MGLSEQDKSILRQMKMKLDQLSKLVKLQNPSRANSVDGESWQVIPAKLTSRDSVDLTKYAWQVARRTTTGWEVIPSGIAGGLTDAPAYNMALNAVNLTNQYVLMVLCPFKDGSGNPGRRWIIISLAPSDVFPVKVTKDGGGATSWTYTVTNLDGSVTYGTALTPAKARMSGVNYVYNNGYGTGFFDGTTFVLFDANEVPAVEDCTT